MNRFACLTIALMLASAGQPALAQLNPTSTAVAEAAAGQLIGGVEIEPDSPPRLSDPQVEHLFNLALPKQAIEGGVADVGEFALQMEVSAAAGRIARAYLLAGTGARKADHLTGEQREKARQNFLAFLPELTRIYDFRLLACARLADGASAFLASAPSGARDEPGVRAGLQAISDEIRTVLAATLSFVADRNIAEKYRMERMRLLAKNTKRFAGFLDLKQSETIADQALAAAIAEKNQALAGNLKDFALAILR